MFTKCQRLRKKTKCIRSSTSTLVETLATFPKTRSLLILMSTRKERTRLQALELFVEKYRGSILKGENKGEVSRSYDAFRKHLLKCKLLNQNL